MKEVQKEVVPPPHNLLQWAEFCWLLATSRTFRSSPNRRKAYFEHCMIKGYRLWFC
jgi:hypothetical protein